MKQKTVFYLLFTGILLCRCTSNSESPDSLPFIDVRKNYPEKEIVLTDIADVTYLHFNTQNDSFLFRGGIQYTTENTFLIFDFASNSILFFSKDGNPLTRFNRYGQGPEEYLQPDYPNVIYDEATDEVYIPDFAHIQVYSSTGKYKRRLTFPDEFYNISMSSIFVSFDDQSLLLYNHRKQWDRFLRIKAGDHSAFSPSQFSDSTFMLISKMDGKVLEYIEMPNPSTVIINGERRLFTPIIYRITRCTDGYLLYHPENDTVYHYKNDKTLTPILHKIPLISESPNLVMNGCIDAGRYQFICVSKTSDMGSPVAYYMRDKETGEVFRQKIVLPDYRGKEFFIYTNNHYVRFLENEYIFYLNLYELKQANKENRLSGELKILVDTLNENKDDDITMIVKFK